MANEKYYPQVEASFNAKNIEEKISAYWKKFDLFKKSIENRDGAKEFVFYDGPPFANGLPHYGHLITGYVKDLYARYQTIKGKKVERRFGWDCHGLPAEMGTEKEIGISGRLNIIKFGIDKFNEACAASVTKYTGEWKKYVERQGRWVDFDNSYKTMDLKFMESVLWVFKSLYDKGLVYEAMRVMPYSWACETPLSNFETRLDDSYRERTDKAVTVGFLLKDKPKGAPEGFKEYRIAAWTTTPWTLPSNLALAVGADIEYFFVPKGEICYLIAGFAVKSYEKELGIGEGANFSKIKGSDLRGLSYEPLFDYFKSEKGAFRIFAGAFVTEGDGTGVVHLAPGFGEEDHELCSGEGIELVCPVDSGGKFTKEVYDFEGVLVWDAVDPIIIKLKQNGAWLKTEQYIHNYPHCWRSDTPLIYKAVPSWYVKVTDIKDSMVELNKKINWIPGHVKEGLFGKWLENARDWSISRNRFFGTPLPIWKSDDPKYPRIDVYGSIEGLERDFGVKVADLHRPFIDGLTRPNPDDPTGKSVMRRIEDVFDCWFESGSMPYGQAHYPFENKERFEKTFPADFIVEYSAQTRGWFYTLMVLSTALKESPPFLNCICHGLILDEKGRKLSKRLNNYADPLEIFDRYGADALRATLLSAQVVNGRELFIDKEGALVFEAVKAFINPIWNAYRFFTLYAEADSVKADLIENFFLDESSNLTDYYILAKLGIAMERIEKSLDEFDSTIAYKAVSEFFESLNNWYIRRSRPRFWKSEKDGDKKIAYDVLYTCLYKISIAASPLFPFVAEEIYLGLSGSVEGDSVHLKDFPSKVALKSKDSSYGDLVIEAMEAARDYCTTALSVRDAENIRIRQPLAKLTVVTEEGSLRPSALNLAGKEVMEEINVKEFEYKSGLEKYADKKLALNFPLLGKRLPAKVKDIISSSKKGEWIFKDGELSVAGEKLNTEEFSFSLVLKEGIKGAAVLPDNSGIVSLDLNITPELFGEGLARDLVRFVQDARKRAGLKVTDFIGLDFQGLGDLDRILEKYRNFIEEQTLSSISSDISAFYTTEVELDGKKLLIKIAKK